MRVIFVFHSFNVSSAFDLTRDMKLLLEIVVNFYQYTFLGLCLAMNLQSPSSCVYPSHFRGEKKHETALHFDLLDALNMKGVGGSFLNLSLPTFHPGANNLTFGWYSFEDLDRFKLPYFTFAYLNLWLLRLECSIDQSSTSHIRLLL